MKKVLFGITCMALLSFLSTAFALEEPFNAKANISKPIIAKYTNIIANNPNDAVAYCRRANQYRTIEQYDLAIEDFRKAIEINPKYAYAYYSRGLMFDAKGDIELAISDYKKAIEVEPLYATNYYDRLGSLYIKNGKYDLAIVHYNKQIEMYPNDSMPYLYLAHAYEEKGLYAEAINVCRRIIKKASLISRKTELNSVFDVPVLTWYQASETAKNKIIELGGTL